MNESERRAFTLHEVLHSLAMIRGNIELGETDESVKEIDRLAEFAQKMLTSETVNPEIKSYKLSELLSDFKEIEISEDVDVECDKNLTQSVLISLLQNAEKHGNSEIKIRTQKNTICIENQCSEKSSEQSFGLGLQFVEAICTTQNASFSWEKNDNTFRAMVTLKIKS